VTDPEDPEEAESDEPLDSLLAAVARIPARAVDRDWTPPAELDEYRMIRPLGRGGMGSVWLAEDTLLDRLVAVKFIAHAEPDQHTRERFAIEARAAARLQHLNVVTVHRYGELGARPYLVSEYIRGESLDKLAKPVPWQRSLELGIALARGLAAAHRHGIIHRDIKPANAILTIEGDAKLVDFGLAKLGDTDASLVGIHLGTHLGTGLTDATDLLTAPGTIAGTPRYLAPEVRRGEPAGRRSDVYQLGAILYELVTGRAPILDRVRPAAASTLDAIVPSSEGPHAARILDGDDLDVPSLVDRVDREGARFAAVVDRCLRRDPADRFASGDELREALETIEAIGAPTGGGELPDGNPYRGLVAFEAEHRTLFFGRGTDIRAVIERLRADPCVLVTGDSGVGKSSLCRAGVLPHLADGALGDGLTWRIVSMVPGQRPLTTLAGLLAPHTGIAEPALLALLRDEPMRVGRELRRAQGTPRGLVLFVDQLEELTTISDRDEAEAFGHLLGQLAAGTPGVRVLATVRSDFLTRLAEVPSLGAELARALYVLRPLSAEAAREAVVGPARAKGGRFESEALVDTLVASVADTTGTRGVIELPLLAFTLAQLWDARDPITQTISARSLEAIGGVRGALARHADGVLDHLLPAQRIVARKLLLRLVTPARTRVRRTAQELAGFDRQALDALVRGRLVVARGDDTPTFELAHERLIDGWPALASWLSETTEASAVHARLAAAVTDWERLERARDELWSQRQLADLAILPGEDLTASEAAFVRASRRSVRRRRITRAGLVLAIPLALATFYVGARVVAQRDLDRHVAGYVDQADRAHAVARTASEASAGLRRDALARFDAGDAEHGEAGWESARQRSAEAEAAYTQTARALEAAFLLDTGRDDVRRELARVTFERLQLAEREYRESERSELATRLPLYDREGELAGKLAAPAQLLTAITPAGAAVEIVERDGTAHPVAPSLAPGSYVLVAHAPDRVTVRLPLLLQPGEQRRIALDLPPASAVPPGLIYIAAGSFLAGSRDLDVIRRFNGAPPMHEVTTPAFLIGRTEVTYAQWIEFLEAQPADERVRRTPHLERSENAHDQGALELVPIAGTWELHLTPASVAYRARAGALLEYRDRTVRKRQDWRQFPVSAISAEDAEAFAGWLDRTGRVPHARLCTGREWEKAARGADGRSYPHGDTLDPDDANIDVTYGRRDGGFGPDVVGSHPVSTSPYGLVDVAGNVWEILREDAPGTFTMRGGAYYQSARVAHLANREVIPPAFRHLHLGLRICADAP
jgi:formylglycine-generating enzyme required for sulfatase activity/predicted Ser/Thr protein kinase